MEEDSLEGFFRKYRFVSLSTCRTWAGKDARLLVIGAVERKEMRGDHDVGALRFVKEQTDEICRYAMEIDPYASRHIRELTLELAEYGCRLEPKLADELQERVRKISAA